MVWQWTSFIKAESRVINRPDYEDTGYWWRCMRRAQVLAVDESTHRSSITVWRE